MGRKDTWKLKDQIVKHDLSKAAKNPNAKKGVLATNHFGRPEGLFFYGSDQTSQLECAVDLDLQKINVGSQEAPNEIVVCVGMQMLCPRCGSPLYIRGQFDPQGHEIVVHWDKIIQSECDGLFRPLISIDGTVGCDYYDSEITDMGKASASNVIMRCGWRGGIINGHCLDHTFANHTGTTKTETDARQEIENEKLIQEMLNNPDLDKFLLKMPQNDGNSQSTKQDESSKVDFTEQETPTASDTKTETNN